jgi:hypothetical protein
MVGSLTRHLDRVVSRPYSGVHGDHHTEADHRHHQRYRRSHHRRTSSGTRLHAQRVAGCRPDGSRGSEAPDEGLASHPRVCRAGVGITATRGASALGMDGAEALSAPSSISWSVVRVIAWIASAD